MPTEEIKLKVASNILADADNVMTAHSYNTVLPRTMTNDNIFKLAYMPTAETGGTATHTYLTATLYADGVPLFSDGRAVLTKVDEKGYNLTLLWGLVDVFDNIKEEDLKLCDLPMSAYWNEQNMAAWVELDYHSNTASNWSYKSGMDSTIYSTLDSESQALADTYPWCLPCVTAGNIMLKLQQVYGLTFDLSSYFTFRRNQIAHPLTSLKVMADGETLSFIFWAKYYATGGHWTIGFGSFSQSGGVTQYDSNPIPGALYASNNNIANDLFRPVGNVNTFNALNEAHVKRLRIHGSSSLQSTFTINPKEPRSDYSMTAQFNSNTGLYEIDKEWDNFTIRDNYAAFWIDSTSYPTTQPSDIDICLGVEFDKIDKAKVGQFWCRERNYPSIGIIDYISELLAHCGAFIVGSVTKPEQLRITTLDEVLAATPVAVDMLGLKEIEMTIDDIAQKNRYNHADNDDGEPLEAYTASGVVVTNDTTLKDEREAFKSDFKVPVADFVELWKVTEENTKAEWNNAGDYIGGTLRQIGLVKWFGNTGQDFAATLSSYYAGYRAIVARPKRIAVIVRLSVLDLLAFDFERPLYINQLGRSYLVESIESDSGDNYKLTLIQI